MIPFKPAMLASLLCSVIAFPGTALSSDSAPPAMPSFEDNANDLATVFSEWSETLESFFSQRRPGYTVVYGIGALDNTDRTSSRYIESVQAAYRQALMNAYMNLSTVLNRDGVDIATSGVQRESRATGDAMFDRIVAECREEAMQAHQAYLRSQDRERAQRESLVGSLAARIRGETGETENSPAEPEGDFIHTCVKPGPTYEQVSTETQQLADVLSGGRIWASILHNNTLGVILVRSPDSTEVAQVLQNQLAPARVLASAREEVRNRVAAELEQFGDDIPYGMVGTRMMRLSNSEWAIYAFGAAQVVSSGGSRFMDTITQDSQRQQSIARAQSELSRFSSLSISYSNQTQDVRSVRVMYRIEYNVTQDRFTSRVDEESTFGQLIDAVYTSSSTLTLRGSRTISTRLVKDENLDYYLSVVAWSPSIMAGQLADRSVQDAAGADAVRSGRYQTPGQSRSSQDGEASERSRVIILNQDW